MNKGFSLVELIVVIAIMAILVGVAVPVYTSYIDKAESNVDKQYADELQRAVDTVVIDIEAGLTEAWKEYNIPTAITWNITADEAGNYVTCTYAQGETENGFLSALATVIDIKTAPKGDAGVTINP